MGHRSKKKKKRGGSSAGGRRTSSSKDDNSFSAENAELITDELTALCAIFQEDCQVVPGSPRQVEIKLRPYSKDTGYENSDVSAILSVRFIPGYPNKCPKLQIVPEKGLSEIDTENLLALLHDQANINSREGRVMIYNLVEAAQEFLSEIVPQISLQATDCSTQLSREDGTMSYRINYPSRGPFVYAYINLFSGSGESWHWNLTMEQNTTISSSTHSDFLEDIKRGHQNIDKRAESELQPVAVKEAKQDFSNKPSLKLVTVEEETDDEIESIKTLSYESFGDGSTMEDTFAQNHLEDTDDDYLDSDPSESVSSKSLVLKKSSQTMKMELLLVHLLRLTCGPNGPQGDILPQITSELFDMGCVSEHVKDLASIPSSTFNKTFSHVFGHHIVTSKFPRFWATSDAAVSRHLNDFVELQPLGRGGYGHVVLCKNKLDGRQYAVKKIRLKEKSLPDRILREVTTLSLLQHQHVVRYYQAWFEKGIVDHYGDAGWESRTAASRSRTAAGSSFSFEEGSLSYLHGHENKSEYLYIQMEYCPRTLRQLFEAYDHFDKEFAWHLFRQIVEGLAHIHGQGIIHRDLTPNNIFFDARNDVKIGDFGLAKFLKREQLEQDIDASEAIGVSIDGTGQVGTYFYTAPEIEQGWPKIDEKADMYSLGVVFFELWHPFQTAMERHVVLSDLKQKGELPSDWVAEFPEQASLLRRLMSSSPSDRPSANELLKHAFPPRMEDELLDDVLRTIHTSEYTIVRDKIVNSLFGAKYRVYSAGGSKLDGDDDTSSAPLIGVNTRNRDNLLEFATGVFRQHCAKHVEIIPMRMLGDCPLPNRNSVKILTQGGDIVELCHELRVPFAKWVTGKQIFFFKRYEISYVYRRAIGHSPPNRYLQGDFDIVGGATPLTEAETIKVTMDIISSFFHSEFCDIHLNHGDLLEAIWTWTGIRPEHRQKVAELLSLLGSLRPQTPERKSKWVVIRRQLQQELNLPEASVNRLQTVGLRFCGQIDQALPRLRGALPADISTCKALDELSELFNYLRVWKIDRHVYIDPLMPPTEDYHRNIFFQVYLSKNPGCLMEGTLLAIGGRYDHLLHSLEDFDHKSNFPGAVGSSLALETILLQHTYVDTKLYRYNIGIDVLVCSRGGGGLLKERMELVAELWEKNINAEIVLTCDPSLKEQYEYANENDIKCLVIITDASVSQTDSVKVRHIEMKKEKSVERENLVKFLMDAMETQFKNPSIWN